VNINSTLFGQAITFAIFVWFTMRFVWPVLMKVLDERRQVIADGLAAGERGRYELSRAHEQSHETLLHARQQADEIIHLAHQRAEGLLHSAKEAAQAQAQQMKEAALEEMALARKQMQIDLRLEVADIAIAGATKILKDHLDPSVRQKFLKDWVVGS
jgi:F-type H+-transporting ATPase subunit b